MKLLSKYIFSALFLAASGGSATAQSMRANTYCNPLNVDYTYMIYNSSNNLSYRSGADPAVVEFRGRVLYVRNPFAWLLAFERFVELGFYHSR